MSEQFSSITILEHNVKIQTIKLKTNLQATAVRLSLNKTITLCSIYIPPNYQLQSYELINLIQQLPALEPSEDPG